MAQAWNFNSHGSLSPSTGSRADEMLPHCFSGYRWSFSSSLFIYWAALLRILAQNRGFTSSSSWKWAQNQAFYICKSVSRQSAFKSAGVLHFWVSSFLTPRNFLFPSSFLNSAIGSYFSCCSIFAVSVFGTGCISSVCLVDWIKSNKQFLNFLCLNFILCFVHKKDLRSDYITLIKNIIYF